MNTAINPHATLKFADWITNAATILKGAMTWHRHGGNPMESLPSRLPALVGSALGSHDLNTNQSAPASHVSASTSFRNWTSDAKLIGGNGHYGPYMLAPGVHLRRNNCRKINLNCNPANLKGYEQNARLHDQQLRRNYCRKINLNG